MRNCITIIDDRIAPDSVVVPYTDRAYLYGATAVYPNGSSTSLIGLAGQQVVWHLDGHWAECPDGVVRLDGNIHLTEQGQRWADRLSLHQVEPTVPGHFIP